jgi:hypothetical protein
LDAAQAEATRLAASTVATINLRFESLLVFMFNPSLVRYVFADKDVTA